MARRQKDNGKVFKIAMSSLIALLMIFSVFGILIGSYSSELRFGKYKFAQDSTSGIYTIKIAGKEMTFYTLPSDASAIQFPNSTVQKIESATYLITTFNPNTANESTPYIEIARFDMASAMANKTIFSSVSEPSELYAALPVFTCENATAGVPVIVFNVSDVIGVHDYGNCIYLDGKATDFLRLRDRILYEHYGVLHYGNI